ncbi:MAG: hypothetical protein HDS30_07960 [Bacteroides sp.]|nr:hypothetical protein [Bacteroides sp.]MDE6043454.1 hypothetical protein [Muribaculaceae bacterium]
MNTINYNDTIYASASLRGRNIANICISGAISTSDIIARLKSILGEAAGMIQITLRNATQGWCRVLNLYMKKREGVQLSLF